MASTISILPKACENCRVRKVRCNRQNPCSNCQTSSIPCRPAIVKNSRKARASHAGSQSSLSSANGVHKHDSSTPQMFDGHAPIRSTQHPSAPQYSGLSPNSPSVDSLRVLAEAAEQSPITSAPFEGSSSFTEQAIHASRIAGVDAENPGTTGSTHHDSVRTAIETPKEADENEYSFRSDRKMHLNFQMEMPPAPFVLDLLKEAKKRPTKMLLAYCMHSLVPNLEALCQSAYFPIEPLSFGALATMYGMLYYMTMDLFVDTDEPLARSHDYVAYSKLLEQNFHLAMEHYSVVVTPTLDNVKALCIGAMKAHSDNKPLLCWSLTAAAARQVLGLGYHRESALKEISEADAEMRRVLFWWVYMFDKSLALRLGRTPNIQDYDIDVQWFKISSDPSIEPYDRANIHWVKLARMQGLIYERLYSVGALRESNNQRAASVTEISAHLLAWFEEWKTFDNSKAVYLDFFNASFDIIEPIYYGTQALVHRATTAPGNSAQVTPACYDAASRSLQAYLKIFKSMQNKSLHLYAHAFVDEILFYTSMTPLVIIFLHAITTPNSADVDLLVKCQETLEQLKVQSTETARVLRVCRIFSRVARSRLQTSDSTEAVPADTTGGALTNIKQAMQISTSNDIGTVINDGFGSFSAPPEFDYNQMSAFFSGWLDCDRMPTELLDMDFVGI